MANYLVIEVVLGKTKVISFHKAITAARAAKKKVNAKNRKGSFGADIYKYTE